MPNSASPITGPRSLFSAGFVFFFVFLTDTVRQFGLCVFFQGNCWRDEAAIGLDGKRQVRSKQRTALQNVKIARPVRGVLARPLPLRAGALATQPSHPQANRYMCRSYHTGRDHPACDAGLRHDPVASLDGTLHRHLHALEQSPAYLYFSADQNGRGLARAPSLSLN
jgi:hypothetical protein